MRTYSPGVINDPELRREAKSIREAAFRADDRVALQYLSVAPERPTNGLYLSAAGVLGVSRGLYRYDEDSGAYTFIA